MRLLITGLLAAFLFVVAPATPAHATECSLPAYPDATGDYYYLDALHGASCGTATKVAKKFWKCRQQGQALVGRCVHKVAKKWYCTEYRDQTYGDYYTGNVTCGRQDNRQKILIGYHQRYAPLRTPSGR